MSSTSTASSSAKQREATATVTVNQEMPSRFYVLHLERWETKLAEFPPRDFIWTAALIACQTGLDLSSSEAPFVRIPILDSVMQLAKQFIFPPLSKTNNNTIAHVPTTTPDTNHLGPLKDLVGKWVGTGFNTIWRPFHDPDPSSTQDSFLELNLTEEELQVDVIKGPIPNRGVLQPDIDMFGVHYLQQITDVNTRSAIHFEPGIWLNVPATTNPNVPASVVRMASIPHGTTVLAQGLPTESARPEFADVNIIPFVIGDPKQLVRKPFENQFNLDKPSAFRSPTDQLVGIDQQMVNSPNAVLARAIHGQEIISTHTLSISSDPDSPVPGGGTANTAFLQGTRTGSPNADAVQMTATFWIETVKGANGEADFLQLQYTQKVLLNFKGLSWPHVSVATLRKVA